MEVWTLMNKKTKELVRCSSYYNEHTGLFEYRLTDFNLMPYWIVNSKEKIEKIIHEYIHPVDRQNYEMPTDEYLNMKDYQIIKLINNF